jgi:hypothetical protein
MIQINHIPVYVALHPRLKQYLVVWKGYNELAYKKMFLLAGA